MGMLQGVRDKVKRVKGAEWAVLLIAIGLAGSLLIAPHSGILGFEGTSGQQPPPQAEGADADALEARLSRVLSSIEGAGRVDVVIHYAQSAVAVSSGGWLESSAQQSSGVGDPAGVVVVAEGAGDIAVRLELARAVQTLLRLDADAVEIFKMESGEQEE